MTDEFSQACDEALQRFMREFGIDDRSKATRHIVQDWLVSHGYLGMTGSTAAATPDGDGDGRDKEFVQYPSYFKGKGSI